MSDLIQSERKLTEWEIVMLIKPVVDATAFLHNKEYIHR